MTLGLRVMIDILLLSLESNTNSIGIRSISAYLKREGYKPALLFLPTFSKPSEKELEEVVSFVKTLNPGLIGISFMSFSKYSVISLTKAIKAGIKIPIIWGGVHATGCPEECLEYVDLVCTADGEETVSNLLDNKKRGISPFMKGVKNIWFRDQEGRVIKNPINIPSKNYDFLPFLDYSLDENYILSEKKVSRLSSDLFLKYLIKHRIFYEGISERPTYLIPVNRGCIFNCTFCLTSKYNEIYGSCNRLRSYSVERIISELEYVKSNLPIFKDIFIYDLDILLNSIDWIREFSKYYSEKIGLPFGAFLSLKNFSYEKVKLLMEAGMVYCEIGIESLSKRINSKIFNRDFDLNKLLALIRRSEDLKGLSIFFDLLANNPYTNLFDRIESFVASIRIAKALIRHNLMCEFVHYKLQLFPGTKLAEMARRDGYLRDMHYYNGYHIKNWIDLLLYYLPIIPEKYSRLLIEHIKILIVRLRRTKSMVYFKLHRIQI